MPSTVVYVSSERNKVTMLKSGAIQRRNYATYHASLFDIQLSSPSHTDDVVFCGLTYMLDIHDSSEPSHYKTTVLSELWRNAMIEEFNALQKQGTWEFVPYLENRNVIGSK